MEKYKQYEISFQNEEVVIMSNNEYVICVCVENGKTIKHNHDMFGIDNSVILDLLRILRVENDTIMEYEKSEMAEKLEELEREIENE